MQRQIDSRLTIRVSSPVDRIKIDASGEDMSGEDMSGEDMSGEDMSGEDMSGEDMSGEDMDDIIIVGGGIGGLTLGLALQAARIPCKIFESAPEIRAVGVGINLLPHATRELAALGLEADLGRFAITTQDATFFNRFGQLIYQEPLGRAAGYDHPQFSIHRADLQMVLLDAFRSRAGHEAIVTGRHCLGVEQDGDGVTVTFSDGPGG